MRICFFKNNRNKLSLMLSETSSKDKVKMDILGNLSPEVAQQVLYYLSPEDIDNVWDCNENWRYLWNYNYFWKQVCDDNRYLEVEDCLTSNIYKKYMLEGSLHWRAVFKYHRIMEFNWKNDNFICIPIAQPKVYTWIDYFDDEIVIATINLYRNVLIDIIDCLTGEIIGSFNEESKLTKVLRHQNLVVFFRYEKLKVWNLETKSWFMDMELDDVPTLLDDEFPVEIYKHLLAFVLDPLGLYIVNLETKAIDYRNVNVVDVSFGDNMIILAIDLKIIFLNLKYEQLMNFYYDGEPTIEYITMMKGGYIFLSMQREGILQGAVAHNVCIFRAKENTKQLHQVSNLIAPLKHKTFLNNNTLLFWMRNNRGTVYQLWDFAKSNMAVEFDGNENGLKAALSNSSVLFIITNDFQVKMMCSKTANFIKNINNDMSKYSSRSLYLTEKKMGFFEPDGRLCIRNYDLIEK